MSVLSEIGQSIFNIRKFIAKIYLLSNRALLSTCIICKFTGTTIFVFSIVYLSRALMSNFKKIFIFPNIYNINDINIILSDYLNPILVSKQERVIIFFFFFLFF